MNRGGLLHAVSIGAFCLLGLKMVALWAGPPRPSTPPAVVAGTGPGPSARSAGVPAGVRDPDITGSIDKPIQVAQAQTAPGQGTSPNANPPSANPAPANAAPSGTAPTGSGENRAGIFDGQRQRSPAERALYERLGERRGELDQRANELDTREKLLQGVEKRLEASIQELKANEERLLATKKQEQEASQTIKNLVTMYEVMKPKDAARVFDRLSHDVLVPVVLLMNPRKMSEVLAAMSPEAAEKLTVALALRNGADAKPAQATLPPNELPALPR